MFWQSKTLGAALQLVAALRVELEAQRTYFESLLNAAGVRERHLLDHLLEHTKKPPAYEPPPPDPAKLAKPGPGRIHFPGYKKSHRPPLPEKPSLPS